MSPGFLVGTGLPRCIPLFFASCGAEEYGLRFDAVYCYVFIKLLLYWQQINGDIPIEVVAKNFFSKDKLLQNLELHKELLMVMRHMQIYRYIAEVARRGSIRGAAEVLYITPSALTRKVQDFEEELGSPIFERLPLGMRLNAAGELLLAHIRNNSADFERLRIELDDLAGVRRGHVSVACAQAFVDSVLPEEIATYRAQFPKVSFSVELKDNRLGLEALLSYEADLALLINPPSRVDIQELLVKKQPLCAVVSPKHPLARMKSVRLKDCCAYPLAMPSGHLAIRALIDEPMHKQGLPTNVVVESSSLEFLRGFVVSESAVTFQPLTGVPRGDERFCALPIDARDLEHIRVVLAQLRGRTLSLAAAKFSDQLISRLTDVS